MSRNIGCTPRLNRFVSERDVSAGVKKLLLHVNKIAISSPPDFNRGTNSFLWLLLSLSRILDRHFGFLWSFPLTIRSQTSVPRSPFPAPRSPLPVPRFSNILRGKAQKIKIALPLQTGRLK